MTDGASALQLVLGGDPALYAIVGLSLYVSLSAVVLAALQFPLSDDQKTLIAKSTADAPLTQSKDDLSKVHVADFLPLATQTQDFSLEVMQHIPAAKQYKFVKLDKRVLLVDAANLTVVGEITQ